MYAPTIRIIGSSKQNEQVHEGIHQVIKVTVIFILRLMVAVKNTSMVIHNNVHNNVP